MTLHDEVRNRLAAIVGNAATVDAPELRTLVARILEREFGSAAGTGP